MNDIKQYNNELQKIVKAFVENYQKSLNANIKKLKESFEALKAFDTDENKKRIIESYKKWGEYGWTVYPYSEINIFYDRPSSLDNANSRMKQYITKRALNCIFEELKVNKTICKKDIEEAIKDYEIKHYRSCAMLLFSLIDGVLIKNQKDEDRNSRGKRSSGSKAIKNIKKHFDEKGKDKLFFTNASFANIISAVYSYFLDGNDFKNEPKLINRNYLMHGMMNRRVKAIDCGKLFLLLYNVLEVLY